MNEFNPKEIKKASIYLQKKLEESSKQDGAAEKAEAEKSSKLKQFVSSIFKR